MVVNDEVYVHIVYVVGTSWAPDIRFTFFSKRKATATLKCYNNAHSLFEGTFKPKDDYSYEYWIKRRAESEPYFVKEKEHQVLT